MHTPWSTYVQDTKMNTREREELRARLLSYMEYHPYHAAVPKYMTFMENFMNHFGMIRTIVSGSVAVCAVIVAMPFFAEGANPGELLYVVKTRINEPLQQITLSTPEEKIAFKTKLLEKRVLEAKLLVEGNGELSPEAEADLSKNIKRHSDEIQKNIEEIAITNEEGAVFAKADLAAELTKTSEIVESIVSEKPAISLSKAVSDAKGVAVESAAIATISAEDKVQGHIERELSRAYELRASLEGKLTQEEAEEVTRRFGRIEAILRGDVSATTTVATSTEVLVSTESESIGMGMKPIVEIAIPKPILGQEDVLTRIKTLITYLSNTALRDALPKEAVEAPVEVTEPVVENKEDTSTSTEPKATE